MDEVCPEGIQTCKMKNRYYWRRYKKHCTQDNDTSVSFKVGTLGPHTVLPITISYPVVFSWISLTAGNLFPFEDDFSLGKGQKLKGAYLGWRGAESPGWSDVLPKHGTRHDAWAGMLLWWSCQSPVAHSCSLLNHLNSFHEEMFKLNAKFDADLLLYLLDHYECDGHTVHMLTHGCLLPPLTSTVKSSLFTHAHSSPLSLTARLHQCCTDHSHYVNNGWIFFWTDLIYSY